MKNKQTKSVEKFTAFEELKAVKQKTTDKKLILKRHTAFEQAIKKLHSNASKDYVSKLNN